MIAIATLAGATERSPGAENARGEASVFLVANPAKDFGVNVGQHWEVEGKGRGRGLGRGGCRQGRSTRRRLGLWQEAGPIEAMSATKSVVGLAIGRLIDQGEDRMSLDQPVSDGMPLGLAIVAVKSLRDYASRIDPKKFPGSRQEPGNLHHT